MPKAYFILMIYNEEDAIPSVVDSIMQCDLPPHYERRILAVQDGSVDRSQELLEEAARTAPVHILSYPMRQGMPESFRGAFEYLEPYLQDDDVVFTMEADATNDIECVAPMMREIEKGADVVIASRYAPGAVSLGFPWWRLWGSNVINFLLRLMWNVPHVTDCSVLYRVYRGALLKKYIADKVPFRARKSFAVISEILLHVSRYTSRFAEVPLRYDYGLKKGPSKMRLLRTLWEYTRITPRTPLHKQPIFWVAFGAFALRVWGAMYGFPDLAVPDEPALTRGALTMLKLHTLIPALHPADFATMYYPPLTAYLYLIVLAPVMLLGYLFSHTSSLGDYATQLVLNPTLPWVATRVVSACIGALTVYFLGRLAERMYPGSGVWAALFLATSFLHVFLSHIARHWTPSVLCIVGMVWAAYGIYHSGQKRWYVLAGVAGGLGVMAGVLPGIVMWAPLLAHFFREEHFFTKLRSVAFWIMLVLTAGITILTFALHPLILHNLFGQSQGTTIGTHKSLLGLADMTVTEVREFAQSDTTVFIFGLVGLAFFLARHRRFGAALALAALLTVLSIYLFHYYLLHYVLLVLPMFVLFAGAGAYELVHMTKTRWLKVVIVVCIFALPTLVALRFSWLWTQPDTRQSARTYIETNLPKDAHIISYMPNVKVIWPSKAALLARLAFDPASSRITDTTLLALATSTYPAPAYSVFELGTLSQTGVTQLTPQFFASHRFDYAVVDRFGTQYPALEQVLARGQVLARFPQDGAAVNIFADNFPGPALLVFAMHQMGPEILIVKLAQ